MCLAYAGVHVGPSGNPPFHSIDYDDALRTILEGTAGYEAIRVIFRIEGGASREELGALVQEVSNSRCTRRRA